MQLETLKNKLLLLKIEHVGNLKSRQFFTNFFVQDYDYPDQAIDAIMENDGSNWGEGENTAYEQGQRDMLQQIIWEMEKEGQSCTGKHESPLAIVQCPHCAKELDNMK